MENGFPILMFLFAAALFLYAGLMALTKDYNILPIRAQVSVKPKDPKKYTLQMAKITALAALAIAAGAAVALWKWQIGALVMIFGVILTLFAGTKIIKKAEQ